MSALINKAFDDIIFENRNKSFGAYSIRKVYDDHISSSMIISVAAFVFALTSPLLYNKYFKAEAEVVEAIQMVEVKLEDVPPMDPTQPAPPPPPKIEMPKLSTVKFLPPVIKPDVEVKDEIPPTVDDLKESNAGTEDQEGELTLDNIIVVDEAKEEIIEEKEEILTWVEEMPEFKGDLGKFIGERLNYPSEAKKELIEGDVWVEFIVNKDGSLTKFKVLKSLGHGCDEEALRVIKQMPSWKPGMQNGKPATTKKKMKISFRFSS